MKRSLVVIAFFLFGCAGKPPQADPKAIPITILHTNDVHGHAWSFGKPVRGGLAAQAALVKKIREEVAQNQGIVFLVSAGDVNTGVAESDYYQGKPDLLAMDAMGYDAMALGNHEFDRGTDQIEMQKKWVNFPILSANISYKDKAKSRLAAPYAILEKAKVKIAFLGLTTDTLKYLIHPQNFKVLDVENPIEVSRRLLPQIQKEGADFVIAVTHMGVSETGKRTHSKLVNDDKKLAADVPEIPLIIGGHSHTLLPTGITVGNTLIAQAGEWSQYLGRVDLVWDSVEHKILSKSATVIPITPDTGEDAEVKVILDRFLEEAKPKFDAVIGSATNEMGADREKVRTSETELGNFVCDVLKEYAKTDVAVFNSGGIRAKLPKGDLRIRDILQAFPFKNTVTTAKLSGALLRKAIQQGVENRNTTGSLLQVSGITYTFQRNTVKEIRVNGALLKDSATYTLATNNFVIQGGDGLTAMEESDEIHETGQSVDELLIAYIKQKNKVTGNITGRIRSIP